MNYKDIGIGIAVTLLAVGIVAVGAFVITGSFGHTADNATNDSTTPQPVSEQSVPEDVKASIDGAKALKTNLSESDTFQHANVSITSDGEVFVKYNSQADNGPALKEEMAGVAIRYADVVGEHNETGGLTVAANGVKLLVSSDAAKAYDDGKLKTDAYKKTFHWE
jgi:hypothetical protein